MAEDIASDADILLTASANSSPVDFFNETVDYSKANILDNFINSVHLDKSLT